MLLMERVRELGADEARVDDQTIRMARQALTREMARSVRPERVRRRGRAWAGVGIGGLVAGAAVTAIVVGSVLAPVEAPSASAADVLNEAAAATLSNEPVLEPGQFLAVSTNFTRIQLWDADAGFTVADRADADAALAITQPVIRYVPADRNADWIVERKVDIISESHGDPAAVVAADGMLAASRDIAGISRFPAGERVAGTDAAGDPIRYHLDGRDFYEGMPEEPEALIDWWEQRYADENEPGGFAHFFIETVTDSGSFNLAPASVRSAMLGAFASITGMTVKGVEGAVTTFTYDRGTAQEPSMLEFALDTKRGYIVSITDRGSAVGNTDADLDGAPTWQNRTESTVRIVDSAP